MPGSHSYHFNYFCICIKFWNSSFNETAFRIFWSFHNNFHPGMGRYFWTIKRKIYLDDRVTHLPNLWNFYRFHFNLDFQCWSQLGVNILFIIINDCSCINLLFGDSLRIFRNRSSSLASKKLYSKSFRNDEHQRWIYWPKSKFIIANSN